MRNRTHNSVQWGRVRRTRIHQSKIHNNIFKPIRQFKCPPKKYSYTSMCLCMFNLNICPLNLELALGGTVDMSLVWTIIV